MGRRILDRRERRRLPDGGEAVGCGAGPKAAGDDADEAQAGQQAGGHEGAPVTGHGCTGAALTATRPSSGALTETLPGATTCACSVFFDCGLTTAMKSPWAPAAEALPRMVRVMPGTS